MPLGIREEKAFSKALNRYLRALREMNFEDSEDVASVLAAVEILVMVKRTRTKV